MKSRQARDTGMSSEIGFEGAVNLFESSSNSVEVDQNEMVQELRKKIQSADITISDQNAVIEELITNITLLEDKIHQTEAQISQLTAHLSFLGLDQKCS